MARGLSQAQLAELIGVSRVSISHWEHGIKVPRSGNIAKLSQALSLPAHLLLGV